MKNRYSIWRLMSLGAALMTAPWLQAQDVLVTLEAEKGIITLPAKVKPVDGSTVEGISGGKYVGDNDPGIDGLQYDTGLGRTSHKRNEYLYLHG